MAIYYFENDNNNCFLFIDNKIFEKKLIKYLFILTTKK